MTQKGTIKPGEAQGFKWIDVNTQLPDTDDTVLALTAFGNIVGAVCWMDRGDDYFETGEFERRWVDAAFYLPLDENTTEDNTVVAWAHVPESLTDDERVL